MNGFKLSKEFREAFRQKLAKKFTSPANQQKPIQLPFQIKHEIKEEIDSSSFHVICKTEIDQKSFKNDNIKTEKATEFIIPTNWSSAKHKITTPQKKIKNSTSRTNQNPRYKNRKQKRRLKALNIYNDLSLRNTNSLSLRQIYLLSWAKSILFRAERFPQKRKFEKLSKDIQPRVIEIQDNDQLNEAFIEEVSEIIPDTLQLAVLDVTKPGGRYSFECARLIEQALSKAVVTFIIENPIAKKPIFRKSVYFDGVLVLDCKDNVAYEFAKVLFCDKILWYGSRLMLVDPQETPFKSIGCLKLPEVEIDKNLVLDILKAQNPSVDMKKWNILNEKKLSSGYRQYSILISNPPVYFQKHKQLQLFFGGSEFTLEVSKLKWLSLSE